MPSLQRALAFAEVDHVAVVVGENLHLDVAGVSTKCSRNSESSPNADAASRRALHSRGKLGGVRDAVHFLTPPPALGLMRTGNPIPGRPR